MPTRSADDFDAIRKHLEEIKKREGESLKTPVSDTVKEDKEPTPMVDEYYGCAGYSEQQLVTWANTCFPNYKFAGPFFRVGDVQTANLFNYPFILLDDGIYPYPTNPNITHPYLPVLYQYYQQYNITVKD